MFPDLTRDDVFRLETRRLWLRWPRASDAAAIRRIVGHREVAERTATIPHPYPPGAAEAFVFGARAGNTEGRAIELVMTLKTTRAPVGLITARVREGEIDLGYVVSPDHWDEGYASEAADALVDIVFALTHAPRIIARVMIDNEASAHVLEKQGFVADGEETVEMPIRGEARRCRRYVLERAARQEVRQDVRQDARQDLRERRVPAMSQQNVSQQNMCQPLAREGAGETPSPEAARVWM